MSERTAVLSGATGLVGGQCLRILLSDEAYGKVTTLGRRTLPVKHPKLEQHAVDFERPRDYARLLAARDVFCCLGTTIKQAGSREAFRRVDFDYQYEAAARAARDGAEQFLLVSALGANARSRVFYNRVKGELEEAIAKLPFEGVAVFRPSLLSGARPEPRSGERAAEQAMNAFSFLLIGPLDKYRPVAAGAVAAAMVKAAKEARAGVNFYESDHIREMAGREPLGG